MRILGWASWFRFCVTLCAIYDHIDNLGRDICESKYLSKDDKISSANETILNDFGVLRLARATFFANNAKQRRKYELLIRRLWKKWTKFIRNIKIHEYIAYQPIKIHDIYIKCIHSRNSKFMKIDFGWATYWIPL